MSDTRTYIVPDGQAVFNGYALGTYAGWNGCGCNNSLWG